MRSQGTTQLGGYTREMAMLIPSIDLMAGKIVQLIQGKEKALEFDDIEFWIQRFSKYPVVQLIDLDAAMGGGNNRALVKRIARALPCRVGGGIHTIGAALEMIDAGASAVICGSAMISEGKVNVTFARTLMKDLGIEKLICAVDSRGGRVAIRAWREMLPITTGQMISELESFCGGFFYTHIDGEGLMQGIPLEVVRGLRNQTRRNLSVAGGISSLAEVHKLDILGVDAVVGMAIYTDKIQA